MRKVGIVGLVLLLIVIAVALFYYDILNLRGSKDDIIAAIIEYEDTRRAPDRLISFLSDPDPEIRARAALAVGRIGDLGAADHIYRLLADSSVEVARTAAFAIGLTGEKKFASQLLELAVGFEPERLAATIEAVGRLTDSGMTDIIDELAKYLDNPDHLVREQAAYALWRAGGKGAAARLAAVGRSDPVRSVKVACLYALNRLGIPEPVDLYSEYLPDSDSFVRSLAIRGLALGKDDTKTFLVAVGLNDRDNNVVSQAISSLTAIGTPRAIGYLAARYESETDEKLKVQLLESFARLKSDTIAEQVNAEIDSCESSNIIGAGIIYLARVNGTESIPLIDTFLAMNDEQINVSIAQALSEIGGEFVKPRLAALFKDINPGVRAAAFEALAKTDPVNIDYYLNSALDDTDWVIVSQAVDKIGQSKLKDYLPRLMGIMKQQGTGTDLKRSVVSAAGEFLNASMVDSLAEDILYHGLQDKDYLVSREAALIYKNKLDDDKTAYINKPTGLIGKREIKSFITKYKSNPRAIISTSRGDIEMELYPDIAPLTVYNFIKLAQDKFYDNLNFHRVVPAFVIQGGDPRGDGSGGPGYNIRCEYSDRPFERGAVGIATSGKDTGGSQFFIMLGAAPHLDARYTLFGKVTAGMDTVDKIVRGDTIKNIRIIEEKQK